MSLSKSAKAAGLFTVVALGAGAALALMTGGADRSGPGVNTDPRSILVEAHLISYRSTEGWLDSTGVSPAQHALDRATFDALVSGALGAQSTGATSVRSPSMLVQHNAEGSISFDAAGVRFESTINPSVVKDDAIRVEVQTAWSEPARQGDAADVSIRTAFTSDGSGGVVLNLAGVPGAGETGVLLALRPTLIEPNQD